MYLDKRPRSADNPRRSIQERFAALNRERLRRIRESLSGRQQDFLELLPLLFHTNHPLLPGYVTQNAPCGVRDYAPARETLAAAQRVTRFYNYDRRASARLDILGLYMMGSCGTIAYSPESDFDIWLCHAAGIGEEGVAELREKACRIEATAREVNLDIHFFVFDPESFRRGHLGSLSPDSSGSSQHYLLLDEFYRSAVVLCGLYPLWWTVPPEEEPNYSAYAENLLSKRFVEPGDYIDFGGLEHIPAREFFGAAVWQLYKSINAPYKSVLKLLLIEAYVEQYPKINLLALHYKRAVYEGETDPNAIDPYLLMYRRVEEYLSGRGETSRLNLFRRCFYFKVNQQLSQGASAAEEDWRREVMRELVVSWGWDTGRLALLDAREDWKLPVVMDERRDLIAALTQGYRLVSQFGRERAEEARISQRDLHILGRKLYAAFERKAGKVEILNRGIAPDLVEQRLSLHHVRDGEGQTSWVLFTDIVAPEEVGMRAGVKRSTSMVDMLAWCHFNRLIDGHTHLSVFAAGLPAAARGGRAVLHALNAAFPEGRLHDAAAEDLTQAPQVLRAALFVDVGVDTTAPKWRGGDLIASSRTDPLSYGGQRQNLTQCFDLVMMTSWEEIFALHYRGIEGLMQCVCEYTRSAPASSAAPQAFSTHCFSPGYGTAIGNRIQMLFDDVVRCAHQASGHWRYILEAADTFHALIRDETGLRPQIIGTYEKLLTFLAGPVRQFTQTVFDRHTLAGELLPLLFQQHRPDVIQTFLRPVGTQVDILVIDERGALFMQTLPFHNHHVLVDHLARFFRSMAQRFWAVQPQAAQAPRRMGVEFKLLAANNRGGHPIEPICYSPDLGRQYTQLKVIAESSEDQRTQYTILCDGGEFSSLEHGNEVFHAVARHVLTLREGSRAYPIYITDLDLCGLHHAGVQPEDTQTIQLLQYKKLIDERFASALRDLQSGE
ncbi:MAG: class I adenylate cyclase [Chromatiales bacterium]